MRFVDLSVFALDGKQIKHLRNKVHNFDKAGIRAERVESCVPLRLADSIGVI
jgi:hypothetical protein